MSLPFFSAEISLVLGFLLVILTDLFFSKRYPQLSFILALLTLLLTAYQSYGFLKIESTPLFGGMVMIDHLSVLFKLLFCLASILFVLFIRFNRAFQSHDKGFGDMYAILLAVHLGLNLMAMSANLLMVYLSLEMVFSWILFNGRLSFYRTAAYRSCDEICLIRCCLLSNYALWNFIALWDLRAPFI
jgi:NADH-quinone oxidoreductase subunit N